MKKVNKILFISMILLFCIFQTSCVKVVKTGEEDKLTGKVTFDANTNVSELWDTDLLPELLNRAVDLSDLVDNAKGDFANVSDMGLYTMGDTGDLNFTVKDEATVIENHSDKKAGYLTLSVDSVPSDQVIQLQVGTLFKGTAIRDNLTSISFDDYQNQIEWGGVSHSLNDKVLDTVIDDKILNLSEGSKIKFTGCFTVSKTGDIVITPIKIEVL